ncbi:MAG: hypothetical protein SV775_03530 [Thermodesulfobacteriota bacterium]|nr:hypothetical protein [Thermodesulfobacteriota bacterium]
MSATSEIGEFNRIEDFISFARKGNQVDLTVKLRKQMVAQKVHPGETEDMKTEIDMYLLLGDYTFTVGGNVKKISKSYIFGSAGESRSNADVDKKVANARLKMDYQRLKDAKIVFEEKYF